MFSIGLNPQGGSGPYTPAIFDNTSYYTNVTGVVADNWAIDGIFHDATNGRYYFTIIHRVTTGNNVFIKVRGYGTTIQNVNNISSLTAGPVYTTNSTVYYRPVVEYRDLRVGYTTSQNINQQDKSLIVSGNVGIGTTTPAQKLHVVGTTRISTLANSTGAIVKSDVNGDLSTITLTGSTNNVLLGDGTFGTIANAGGVTSTCGTANYVPKMNSSTSMSCSQIFDNGNNVGIGTTAPGAKLQVSGDAIVNDGVDHVMKTAAQLQNNTTARGGIYQNSGDGLYNASGTALALEGWWHVINMHHQHNNGFNAQIAVPLSASPNDIFFRTSSAGTWTEWRKVLSESTAGNVGIGTTSPAQKLDVQGSIQASNQLISTVATGTAPLAVSSTTLVSNLNADMLDGHHWSEVPTIPTNNVTGSGTATQVAFWSGTNTLSSNANLYWDNTNGRLGVGTSTPSAKLHLSEAGASDAIFRITPVNGTYDAWIQLTGQDNNISTEGFYIQYDNDVGDTYFKNVYNATNAFHFLTNAGEQVTIKTNGNVGIGTTTPAAKLHVAGNIKTNTINETSDARFKKNIQSIDTPLSKVLSLRGVYFYWDLDNPDVQEIDSSKQIGMIAQEVEKILPELVNTDANGYKSVEYSRVVAVLIEAMKEQQKTIDEQKDMINDLNERITKLEELIKVK